MVMPETFVFLGFTQIALSINSSFLAIREGRDVGGRRMVGGGRRSEGRGRGGGGWMIGMKRMIRMKNGC
ncbi:MAG: hypothetical protein QG577_393 [Thermodesulfobacteriota bacterium]|nr:hypothetical protein [Thermodesulfobacteriota bacterium]